MRPFASWFAMPRVLVALLGCATSSFVLAGPCFVYVGTYTDWELFGPPRRNPPGERSQGIYVFPFDPATGQLGPRRLAAETPNPTYVTFSPSGRVLYAVNEIYLFHGAASGAVSAFRIDPATGGLAFLNQVEAHGTGTCYACVDRAGDHLLAANFGSGSAAVFPLEPGGRLRPASAVVQDTGSGPNPRQAGPHAHAINLSPDERFAIVSEFGTDRLALFRFDSDRGTLTPAEPPHLPLRPGSAPRHLAFHPSHPVAYSLNEIDNTITVLAWNATRGSLRELQNVSTLPSGFSGRNTAAEVIVHPSGRFLYASNRGNQSLAVFSIDNSGRIALAGHVSCGGRTPRGFAVDPDGRWLIAANQDTHNLVVFAVDEHTGMPVPTGQVVEVRTPVCVKFLRPTG